MQLLQEKSLEQTTLPSGGISGIGMQMLQASVLGHSLGLFQAR